MAKIKDFTTDQTMSAENASTGEDVDRLQGMLERFGYLRPGSYEHGTFDAKTERAVRKYQRFTGLTVDGVAGPKTKSHIIQPRCVHQDSPGGSTAGAYSTYPAYTTKNLSYCFINNPADLDANAAKNEIRAQFAKWQAVSHLKFTEVTATQNPTFRISWHSGDHGDGEPFDGPGNTLAHAFYPPPMGGTHAGEMHFDEDETFSLDGSGGTYSVGAVALHEIGHLIGLAHSQVQDAVMYPYYDVNKTTLRQDDINGVRDLYGIMFTHTASLSDSLGAAGESDTWQLSNVIAGDMNVVLDGPDNADFDLYVKFNATASEENFDYRSWTAGDEELVIIGHPAGYASFHVVSYEGSGNYSLVVQATLNQ